MMVYTCFERLALVFGNRIYERLALNSLPEFDIVKLGYIVSSVRSNTFFRANIDKSSIIHTNTVFPYRQN